MARSPRRREALELHDLHERILAALGSDTTIPPYIRRRLLELAHEKQDLLQRAGMRPSREDDPLVGT